MDLNALRVFDCLHKLKLTEEDYKAIEEEQTHTERTGLSIKAVAEDQCICVCHDENHKIVIKEIPKVQMKPNTRILLKTLVTFDNLPEQVYTLHGILQYRASDYDIKRAAHNLEELKDCMIDRFIDRYPKALGDSVRMDHYCYDEKEKKRQAEEKKKIVTEQLKAIYWLFDEPFNDKIGGARPNVSKIVKVFQRKNRRLALIQEFQEYEQRRGGYGSLWYEHIANNNIKVIVVSPADARYNYVSPGREFYIPRDWHDKGQIWLDDDLTGKIDGKELQILSQKFGDQEKGVFLLLNADNYNKMSADVRIELMAEKRKAAEADAKKQFCKNTTEQFKNGKVIRKGITFTEKSISYEGISFEGPGIKDFIIKNQVLLQEEPEINKIFEDYVIWNLKIEVVKDWNDNSVRHIIGLPEKTYFVIRGIRVDVEKNRNNIFINNMRICKGDVVEVLKDSIHFSKQEDYDAYLKKCNLLSMTLQKCLAQGAFSFQLMIDQTDDNSILKNSTRMLLSLPYIRKNNKNYVIIKGQEYKVRDVNALLELGEKPEHSRMRDGYLQRAIKLLYRAIDGISPKIIADLIREGSKEYEKLVKKINAENARITKKSKEFLAHAVKITKAKKIPEGYLVKGLSGTKYTINEKTLAVYTLENNKPKDYLCIVDVGNTTVHNDRLAKRILALAHDTKVAGEIHTLGDHLDKHWSTIAPIDIEESENDDDDDYEDDDDNDYEEELEVEI